MTRARTVTMRQFQREIGRLQGAIPKAIEAGFREGAMKLAGPLIQDAIATSTPHIPVDQGQFKASWRSYETKAGFLVTSLSQQAVFIERGRGPGPLPMGAEDPGGVIYEWVRRKGFWKDTFKSHLRAARITAVQQLGPLQRARKTDSAARRASLAAFRKQRNERERANAKENAIKEAAYPIALSIMHHGTAPRWVLRRAVVALRPQLRPMILAHLAEIRA